MSISISINEEKNRIVRHGVLELTEHWVLALSGLVLLLSGLFELPVAARYKIIAIPGFAWSGDFIASLTVHYIASVVFIVAAFFHLFYHGLLRDRGLIPQKGDLKASIAVVKTFFGKGEEPPFDKYLPEQRLAYLGMAGIIAVIILTGLIKTYKNVYAPDLSHTLIFGRPGCTTSSLSCSFWLSRVISAPLLSNRTGRWSVGSSPGAVRLDYARHRHPLWLSVPDTRASQPPVQAVGISTLVETGTVMVENPPAGASGKSSASPGAGAAGMSGGNE